MDCETDALHDGISANERSRSALRYEQLGRWAKQQWQYRYPDQPYIVLWAADECGSELARQRLKPGRKVKETARYLGYQSLDCPYIVPITASYVPARKVVLTDQVGAFIFSFQVANTTVDVLFASAHYNDEYHCKVAIALVPPARLEIWKTFERQCKRAARYLERSQSVYVIGGATQSFEPVVEWDQVILSETLKADLRADVETFFSDGVAIYRQLNLPPFRKLLLVGPPGTGKTTLCAALAKLALRQKCVVVYVSAADEDGASFDKIHDALRIVANSRHPVLLIVEELDVYLTQQDRSQILNVLDGLESPNNPRGALLLATTNYPEVIDERIAKRPGRVDRIVYVPTIQDEDQAVRMLKRYLGPQWQDDHPTIAIHLIGQTGAFVREVAIYARLLAAHDRQPQVSLETLHRSIINLKNQLSTGDDLLPRRPIGFAGAEAHHPYLNSQANDRL